jgi:NAD(P)-dependent dehydrogenase (short-subunit alcohol dehydrogenase family)
MRDPHVKNRDQAQTLNKQGIEVIELDASNDASGDQAVNEVLAHAYRIDVLVTNAGASLTEAFTPKRPGRCSTRTSSDCSAQSARYFMRRKSDGLSSTWALSPAA